MHFRTFNKRCVAIALNSQLFSLELTAEEAGPGFFVPSATFARLILISGAAGPPCDMV